MDTPFNRLGTGPSKLPKPWDFGADDRNNPDARHAWDEFGGLSIDEAFAKFVSHPPCFQEDFMFMGGSAFAFYYPVLDRYLREYRVGVGPGDDADSYAAVIAGGLCMQLLAKDLSALEPLIKQISDLADYVRSHTEILAEDPDEQADIDSVWQVLQAQLSELRARSPSQAKPRTEEPDRGAPSDGDKLSN